MTDAPFHLGERVIDTEAAPDERAAAVVVALPDETAAEWSLADHDTTVADQNPAYPAADPDVTVAYVADLEAHASGWDVAPPATLADELALIDEITLYTYPTSRLAPAADA